MNMKFVKSGEKKRLLKELKERFGIEKLDSWILVETGKNNRTRENQHHAIPDIYRAHDREAHWVGD